MNKKSFKDIWLIPVGIIITAYVFTFGFLFMFASIGLHEAEKQSPHAFDGHKYVNYNFFDSFMKIAPIIGIIILIAFVVLIAMFPINNQEKGMKSTGL